MTIGKGVALGPYEILTPLGAGGMGEVWRARDRRIGREVAVKVLPQASAAGEAQVRRFEQEARAAGALNHPGLVTIFDVGMIEGSPYIVMELLEGETLRDALGSVVAAPLPLPKAIDYAIQIASALATAHEKGITHRDLKPENIFVTPEGRVKILDFGLAKLTPESVDGDDQDKTARHLTSSGMVVGTPGYMSPEQVRSRPLDHRTDIFAFGAVLYEMLSGRRAFERPSAVETMHAVLNDEPPPLSTPSRPLEAIVRHCLEKNPRQRFQSARDLAFQLETLSHFHDGVRPLSAAAAKRRGASTVAIGVTAALALALAAGGAALYRARVAAEHPPPRRFTQLTFADGVEMFPTLSPDGKTFAYVSAESGNRDIYVQRVDGKAAIDLTSDSPESDSEPAFSPDGALIAFRSERDGGGIFVMGATGESVRRLTDFGHNPSWSPDGARIVVSTAAVELRPHVHPNIGDLWIVDARTGAKRLLFRRDAGNAGSDALQPSWSPNGRRIAFWGISHDGSSKISTIDPDAPEPRKPVVVMQERSLDWNPVWSPDGRYLYFGSDRDGTLNLWRVAMHEGSGTSAGAPEPMSLPGSISGNFTISQHGEIAFSTITRLYRLLALPFDANSGATGAPRSIISGPREILSLEPSPDRQAIAVTLAGAQEDVFVANANGTRLRQLTDDAAKDRLITWSPDGKTLYFYSNRGGAYRIWSIRADGSGLTCLTSDDDLRRYRITNLFAPNASPDGHTLTAQTDRTLVLLHLDRPIERRIELLDDSLSVAMWSPAGGQLLGIIDTTSPADNGVAVYSLSTRRGEKVFSGDASPQWLPDGKHIAVFERHQVGIVDLVSRRVTASPFAVSGVEFGAHANCWPHLSKDGSTLYVRQTLEQGDIWMLRLKEQ